jgi:hypothetical protein
MKGERAVVPSGRRHGHHVRVHHISGLDRVEVNGELRCILVQEPKHVELTEGGDGDVSLRVNTRINMQSREVQRLPDDV